MHATDSLMDKKFKLSALFCLLLLTGCDKYYLSLRQVPVDASYLASTQANTPDPRRACPPHGLKIVLQWAVPPEIIEKKPQIILQVIYKNHTEKTFVYPIDSRLGSKVYTLLDQEYDETGGVLTYRAEIMTPDHQVYREWKHQLWVNLITLDEETPEEVLHGTHD
jgi:hypothetical protein